MIAAQTRAAGPHGHWLLGSLRERKRDPLAFFRAMAAFGDVSTYRILGIRAYCVNHPDLVRLVLVERAERYGKGRTLAAGRPLLGRGLLTVENEAWRRSRRIAQPAFARERMLGLADAISRTVDEHIAAWSETIDAGREMSRLSIKTLVRLLFSDDLGELEEPVLAALKSAIGEVSRRILRVNPLGSILPTADNRAFRRNVRFLDGIVRERIAKRRAAATRAHDLLTLLIEAENGALDDAQLRDEIFTFLVAGYESMASALAWSLDLLARHAQVQDELRRQAVIGAGRPGGHALPRLNYAGLVFKETLRLYPPAWLLARQAREDDTLGPYAIPRGAYVLVSPYAIHRLPAYWDEPDRFDPNRFQDESARPAHAYLPFGAGPRACIGYHMAMMTAQLVLTMVTRRFQLEPVRDEPVQPQPRPNLPPSSELVLRLTRRADQFSSEASVR